MQFYACTALCEGAGKIFFTYVGFEKFLNDGYIAGT